MPQGKGTYGSKVGRPKKVKAKRARSMPLDKEQAEKAIRSVLSVMWGLASSVFWLRSAKGVPGGGVHVVSLVALLW